MQYPQKSRPCREAKVVNSIKSAALAATVLALAAQAATAQAAKAEKSKMNPVFRSELIFSPQHKHNHGSCVVEMPGGGLFACWYRGSGERSADDVAVMGSRLPSGNHVWEEPFVLSDTPGFPDTNPCLWVDPFKRLWLFHSTILNNQWESAITRVKISSHFNKPGTVPKWDLSDLMLLKPGPEFSEGVERDLERVWAPVFKIAPPDKVAKMKTLLTEARTKAKDKFATRMGWMTRAHPTLIRTTAGTDRLLVPLYSDGFDFSLIGYTDDWGATWKCSAPIIGQSNVQPSILQRKDQTLIAFFRDNGPPPQRIMQSESTDDGVTWTVAHDIVLWDPGAGVEAIKLKSGRWLMINNDTEDGRHSLAISVSEDEGRTWLYKKHVEHDEKDALHGSYAYPSIIQARNGSIHITYSITPRKTSAQDQGVGESIKHVELNEDWVIAPEGRINL